MENFEQKSRRLRKETFDLGVEYKDMHIASALSMIEILISIYDSDFKQNDRFILSKGHGCLSYYAMLRQKGFNPNILAHPDKDLDNGIQCTTGSLGHGLPMAVGMAFAKKLKNDEGKVYALIGDGECQEGSIWESLGIASHNKLNNLIGIIDYNKIQALDYVENVLSLGNLEKRFDAFGCYVSRVNGHSINDLIDCYNKKVDKPHMIIADTIKGKGLSFMENDPKWQSRFPNDNELKIAYKEL